MVQMGDNASCSRAISNLNHSNIFSCKLALGSVCVCCTHYSQCATEIRVGTDLDNDSEPHPVHCGLNRCQSNFVDRHWSNSTSN